MNWAAALAIYFLFWFLCLFFVLPFHGRRDAAGEGTEVILGHDTGAPHHFPVWRVIIQVTLLAAGLFALYYAAYSGGHITRDMFNIFGRPPG